MNTLKVTAVVICFGLFAACGDDEEEGPAPDGGTDAAIDATVDAAPDTGEPTELLDSTVAEPDSAVTDASIDAEVDAGLYVEVLVNLTTAAEVPACTLAGPNAKGRATVLLPKSGASSVQVIDVSWENLSSAVTSAHIHYAAAGESGPIALTFSGVTPPVIEGWTSQSYFAAAGLPTSFDAFVDELKAGKTYLNFHTQSCPGGELRGQIVLP